MANRREIDYLNWTDEKLGDSAPFESLNDAVMRVCEANPKKNPNTPIFLVSAEYPGSGSTTVVGQIASLYNVDSSRGVRSIGHSVRADLKTTDDASLVQGLGRVPAPIEYDPQFYQNLPDEGATVIDGKLAVATGPTFLERCGVANGRPVIGIVLRSHPLISAVRIMRREGRDLPDLIRNPMEIPGRADALRTRAEHLKHLAKDTLRQLHTQEVADCIIEIDTARLHEHEISGWLAGNPDWINVAPNWESDAVSLMIANLDRIGRMRGFEPKLKDEPHFRENIEGATYNLTQRLHSTINAPGLQDVRANIRNMLTHASFALLLKKMPRFLRDIETGEVLLDTISQGWTPEYYKMMKAWNTIKIFLKDKAVFDGFAGAGTFVNVLTARGLVKDATFGDISYEGGRPLNGSKGHYDLQTNMGMVHAVFDGLPSWYKPECLEKSKGVVTLDSHNLPFPEDAFDVVTGDPPYGVNLSDGGLELFLECLPEMNRVSKEGGLYLIPMSWIGILKAARVQFNQLTEDLASSNSDVPTCFIFIPKY